MLGGRALPEGNGRIPADFPILTFTKLSILSWVSVISACGWIGAGSAIFRRNQDSRLLASAVAGLMMPASVALTLAALIVPPIQGGPRIFPVIRKSRSGR